MVQPVSRFRQHIGAKTFFERWAVTVGLSLHYYSARMRSVSEVKSYIPQTASLLANPAAAPIQTYPMILPVMTRSLPIAIISCLSRHRSQWQINHSRVLPLWWEGGLSLSYLMGSEALYYNPHSGVDFKDARYQQDPVESVDITDGQGLPLGSVRLESARISNTG